MHRVELTYALMPDDGVRRELHHPLLELLEAIDRSGSISAAARQLEFSYRHVWGELKRWESELGHPLVLWVERQPQARLAPQLATLRSELERAFAVAFDDAAGVIEMYASHDEALPLLRD